MIDEEELARRARSISWILLDVDGVLTAGTLTFDADGRQLMTFNVKDGLAVNLARRAGLEVGILSGRSSRALQTRAAELGIETLILGRHDKGDAFDELLRDRGLEASAVAYVGDDLQDLPVLSRCGLSFAPADAAPEVRESVHRPLATAGGRGAVREMVEVILEARGEWERIVAEFRHG